MPLYEFKCLKCEELFELLIMNPDEMAEMKCPGCKSANFERVLSTTNYAMGNSGKSKNVASQTRTCSGGSCTTYDIPGSA